MSNTSDVAGCDCVPEINITPAVFRPAEILVEGLSRRLSCNNESVKLFVANACWEECRLLRQSGLVCPWGESEGREASDYAWPGRFGISKGPNFLEAGQFSAGSTTPFKQGKVGSISCRCRSCCCCRCSRKVGLECRPLKNEAIPFI